MDIKDSHSEISITSDDELSQSSDSSTPEDRMMGSSSHVSHTQDPSSSHGDHIANEKKYVQETHQVQCLKLVVMLVLLLAAGGVAVVIWWIANQAEENEFEVTFEASAKKLLDTFHNIAKERLGAISSLSVAGIAHSIDHERKWPYMTLSWFQHRTLTTRDLSGALFVSINPLVSSDEREEWENYTWYSEDASWHSDGMEYQQELGYEQYGLSFDLSSVKQRTTMEADLNVSTGIANHIFTLDETGGAIIDRSLGPYLPTWQTSPVFGRTLVNRNLLQDPDGATPAAISLETSSVVFGGMEYAPPEGHPDATPETALYTVLLSILKKTYFPYQGGPMTRIYVPLFDSFANDKESTALVVALIRWETYFKGVLTDNIRGIYLVLENTCGDTYTYIVEGDEPNPVGPGDLHDTKYDYLEQSATFSDVDTVEDGSPTGLPLDKDHCVYSLHAYPSDLMHDDIVATIPLLEIALVAAVFIFTGLMFYVYDRLVERRQQLVLSRAEKTGAIVSMLYPKAVRDRLFKPDEPHPIKRKWTGKGKWTGLRRHSPELAADNTKEDVIADLFPNATIFFADIAGFTAWSSTREPAQVFELLEGLYHSFDLLAKRRRVFKVETVGDCYVAVTGCPQPQKNHAVIMARFATECLLKMNEVTRSLETTLGPDTGDLKLRVGIHSGPVTAGVLRGEKGRFQLFGDTVNTASRMESTGIPHRIQVSQETADLLNQAGKGDWVTPREDAVNAKGKGVMKTYWVHVTSGSASVSSDSVPGGPNDHRQKALELDEDGGVWEEEDVKRGRMVDWMTELLLEQLKHLLAKRKSTAHNNSFIYSRVHLNNNNTSTMPREDKPFIPLDEVVEAVELPEFDAKATQDDWRSMKVDPVVHGQLRLYVDTISKTYRDNPFHNFEHACHVTQNASKFLNRIVSTTVDQTGMMTSEDRRRSLLQRGSSDRQVWRNKSRQKDKLEEEVSSTRLLHDYTHGITSDPLTLFAIIFSAMIHDADHRGVSNGQLAIEMPDLANHFRHKSLAEQNSLDIAWSIFMNDRFTQLRDCLFTTQEEHDRFRQVLVNVVMATDIFDKELNDLRKQRWATAFSNAPQHTDSIETMYDEEQYGDDDVDDPPPTTELQHGLQATIVLEHIIQASDVSHTMQHWHVYRRWNQRLFNELCLANRMGRMGGKEVDPSTFWYKSELKFFDTYIIPLAKKLKDCRVFGVNSHECLNYALRNRAEWAARGQEEVAVMLHEFQLANVPAAASFMEVDEYTTNNDTDDHGSTVITDDSLLSSALLRRFHSCVSNTSSRQLDWGQQSLSSVRSLMLKEETP